MMDLIKQQEIENYLAQQGDIEFALLFGSMALGRETPMSDIDIARYILKMGTAL